MKTKFLTIGKRGYRFCEGLAVCLCLVSSLQAQDKVYPVQGAVATGKIIEITRNEITIEVRGNKQKLPLAEVRKVTFDDEPSGLDRAAKSLPKSSTRKSWMN